MRRSCRATDIATVAPSSPFHADPCTFCPSPAGALHPNEAPDQRHHSLEEGVLLGHRCLRPVWPVGPAAGASPPDAHTPRALGHQRHLGMGLQRVLKLPRQVSGLVWARMCWRWNFTCDFQLPTGLASAGPSVLSESDARSLPSQCSFALRHPQGWQGPGHVQRDCQPRPQLPQHGVGCLVAHPRPPLRPHEDQGWAAAARARGSWGGPRAPKAQPLSMHTGHERQGAPQPRTLQHRC